MVVAFERDFGDGTPHSDMKPKLGYPTECGYTSPDAMRNAVYTHTYAAPGTYTFQATVSVWDPCDQTLGQIVATQSIVVAANEQALTNGSTPPHVDVLAFPLPGDPGEVTIPGTARIQVAASDEDGFVAGLSIDWGDGSELTRSSEPFGSCTVGQNGWPTAGSSGPIGFAHDYAVTGTYSVTVVATSTGCGGADPQDAISTVDVVIG